VRNLIAGPGRTIGPDVNGNRLGVGQTPRNRTHQRILCAAVGLEPTLGEFDLVRCDAAGLAPLRIQAQAI